MADMTDYIKIESYLKDVPDNFLMKEIQRPTGEYPPVLIVAEYNRRKRMRNAAQDQQAGEPKSLVEDIKQEAGLMSAPGAMQTLAARDINRMGPPPEEMRPMPQQMPQQMPIPMSRGGLVAFEGGGPIRAQEGLYTGYRPSAFERFIGFNLFGAPEGAPTGITGGSLAERAGVVSPAISRLFPNETDKMLRIVEQQQKDALAEQMRPYAGPADPGVATQSLAEIIAAQNKPQAAPGDKPAPGGAPGGLGAFKPGRLPSNQPVIDAIKALREQTKMPTESDIEAAGQARARRYEEELPFREKAILEERITNRAEQIAKDKDMSFNDALIAAGAAILKSPGTPGSIAWMGEGLSAFGSTMKEGRKDLRKSQELMEQAQLELARAESARDAGKFNQYEAGREKFLDLANKSREFAATNAALAVNQYTAEVAAAKLPYELAEMKSKADYQSALGELYKKGGAGALTAATKAGMEQPTAMDIQMAQIAAAQEYERAKIKASPQQIEERAQLMLKRQFPGYTPLPPVQPAVRSVGEGQGATLPGT